MTLQTDRARKWPFCDFCSVQIAYTETERIIGDAVKFQHKKNFKNTVLFPTRFLGLNAECKEQLELE
jgi:hypothetical protein